MPKFTIYVQRQFYEYNSFEIEAETDEQAKTLAIDFIQDENHGDSYDEHFHNNWSQSDCAGDIELDEIIQEDATSAKTLTPPQSHLDWITLNEK